MAEEKKKVEPVEEKKEVDKPTPIKAVKKVVKRVIKKKEPVEAKAFEDREDLKTLLLYIVIVNYGQGSNVIKLLKSNHCSMATVQVGEGTANKQIRNILAIEDDRKDIVYSFIREEYIDECKRELEAYFAASKRNAGVAFTIKLNSIIGVKMYKFLSQTVRG